MKLLKLKLLVIAIVMFVANSAFAMLAPIDTASYNVSIDTTSLSGRQGYLYLAYIPFGSAVDSFAMVSGYAGGMLAGSNSSIVVDGSAVYGQLPGNVYFYNATANNDYNHGVTFGNSINFSLTLSRYASGGDAGDSSTFSLGLFADENGETPLTNVLGLNNTTPGILFTVSLFNDGATSTEILASEADVTPTPIPAAFWLLGSGLAGLAGAARRKEADEHPDHVRRNA